MFPIYFGDMCYIGDIELRNQYELDMQSHNKQMELCNDQCSYCILEREELAVKDNSIDTPERPNAYFALDVTECKDTDLLLDIQAERPDTGQATGPQFASDTPEGNRVVVDCKETDPAQDVRAEGEAMGPLNIIAAAIPNEWSIACQEMCTTCNRWYQTDGDCAECSPSFEVIVDESSYESLNDCNSYSGSSSDDSFVLRPKRKRKYKVKNDKTKNVLKYKRKKK